MSDLTTRLQDDLNAARKAQDKALTLVLSTVLSEVKNKRIELRRGPTIRRGARVGGGAVLCPGIEVGEEAFVGAGAVVVEDVPARAVVVGNPARKIREVPTDELLPEPPGTASGT